jgi:hypothetical protein
MPVCIPDLKFKFGRYGFILEPLNKGIVVQAKLELSKRLRDSSK